MIYIIFDYALKREKWQSFHQVHIVLLINVYFLLPESNCSTTSMLIIYEISGLLVAVSECLIKPPQFVTGSSLCSGGKSESFTMVPTYQPTMCWVNLALQLCSSSSGYLWKWQNIAFRIITVHTFNMLLLLFICLRGFMDLLLIWQLRKKTAAEVERIVQPFLNVMLWSENNIF